ITPQHTSPGIEKLTELEGQIEDRYEQARGVWAATRPAIEELLSSHPGLNQQSYSPDAILRRAFEVDRYLFSGDPIPLNPALHKFCSSEITGALKRGFSSPPAHRFFLICDDLKTACDDLTQAYDLHLTELKSNLFRYAKGELRERKREQNVRYFDDLLLDLYSILQSPRGHEVAQSIRSRYKAALIDEFQDTDPVQYSIFDAVFKHRDTALFL